MRHVGIIDIETKKNDSSAVRKAQEIYCGSAETVENMLGRDLGKDLRAPTQSLAKR